MVDIKGVGRTANPTPIARTAATVAAEAAIATAKAVTDNLAVGKDPAAADKAVRGVQDALNGLSAKVNANQREINLARWPEAKETHVLMGKELNTQRTMLKQVQASVNALAANPKATAADWEQMNQAVATLSNGDSGKYPVAVAQAAQAVRHAGGARPKDKLAAFAQDLGDKAMADLAGEAGNWTARINNKLREMSATSPDIHPRLKAELEQMQANRKAAGELAEIAGSMVKNPAARVEDWQRLDDRLKEAMDGSPEEFHVHKAVAAEMVRDAGKSFPTNPTRLATLTGLAEDKGAWEVRIAGKIKEALGCDPEKFPSLKAEIEQMRSSRRYTGRVEIAANALADNPKATPRDWAAFKAKANEALAGTPEEAPLRLVELHEINRSAGGKAPVPARREAIEAAATAQGEWTVKIAMKIKEGLAATPELQGGLLQEGLDMKKMRDGAARLTGVLERLGDNPLTTAKDWAKLNAMAQDYLAATPGQQALLLKEFEGFEYGLKMRAEG